MTQKLATGGILRRPNPDNPGGSVAGYAGAILMWDCLRVFAERDDWHGAPITRGLSVGCAVIPFVGDRRAGPDVWSEIHQRLEMPAVGGFSAGQIEGNGEPVEVCFQLDFGSKPTARAAERLTGLPLLPQPPRHAPG